MMPFGVTTSGTRHSPILATPTARTSTPTPDDLRLIEDYLPIEAISAEASREKSVRKGHISTLHLWWARRPLVACRAAVYGALVPADRWVKDVNVKNADGKDIEAFKAGTKRGLNRRAAKEFVTKLCRYPKCKPTKPADVKLKRETEGDGGLHLDQRPKRWRQPAHGRCCVEFESVGAAGLGGECILDRCDGNFEQHTSAGCRCDRIAFVIIHRSDSL